MLQARLNKEIKEMDQCTFKPSIATSGKNFSHQDRQGSTFFERNKVWRDQVEHRINGERDKS